VTRRAVALLVLVVGLAAFDPFVMVLGPALARAASEDGTTRAYVVLVRDASLSDLLSIPDVRALASAGGAGWMSPELDVRAFDSDVGVRIDPFGPSLRPAPSVLSVTFDGTAAALHALFAHIGRGSGRVLVAVVGTDPSPAMAAAKDETRPIVLAEGQAAGVFAGGRSIGTLTSDSTRRTGIVASPDLEATIDAFLGASTRGDVGHDIRIVREPPPYDLHERYLEMRRLWVPVQTAAALYVTMAGIFALAVLWLGRRARPTLGLVASGAAISIGPLAAALLAAGHLPSLSYATVVPFVVAVTLAFVVLVLLGAFAEGVLHPILPLGIALLAFLVVEDLLGWRAALTPFLGGAELDGGRFFGLPNVFIGLLLGASLYAAARMSASAGFAILLGAALLAGLPFAGANLGGAVTLFAAAGLWLPLRTRGRLRLPELAFAGVVVVVGTGLVLVAHRFSSLPTHVTTFEQTDGAGGALSTFADRLSVGWRLIEHNPFALAPVVGMLVTLAVVVRPPSAIAPSLARHPAWRDALFVLLVASVVAYVVNDTGAAACGVGFGMALGGLLYVSVAERTWKMAPA